MKFAKIVFWIAAIWGVLVLTPLYFIFDLIGQKDPPPITHPAFYYGFISLGLVFQVVFIVIARDPVRLRPMMIPSILEKFGYGATLLVLYLQNVCTCRISDSAASTCCLAYCFWRRSSRPAASLQSTIDMHGRPAPANSDN
jgi:hypothetical protein